MNSAIYNVTLDVNAAGSQTALAMRRGDTGRILNVNLRENTKPYVLAPDAHAVFAAKKPDSTVIFNDCQIDGNTIIYKVTEQTTAAEGVVEAEIRIYDLDNNLLCSPRFDINVDATATSDKDIESTNEFATLTRLISEATKLIEETNAALQNGDFVPAFTIGTVESLPSYSEAQATITGTGKNPILNLGIPRGGNGSEVNHNLLLGLDLPDQHPIAAVTGLTDALEGLTDALNGKQPTGNYALKSELPTKLSELAGDAEHRSVTDVEKDIWNGKQNAIGAGGISSAMIANNAVSKEHKAKLTVAGWGGGVTQSVSVPRLKAASKITVDIDCTGKSGEGLEALNDVWGSVLKAEASNGSISVTMRETPEVEIPLKIVEVLK